MIDVAALCIGDELLDGRVRDANAHEFGAWLKERGLSLGVIHTIDDHRRRIREALEMLADRGFDLIVVCGGLGPTRDDITREAAADFAGVTVTHHDEICAKLRERFASRGRTFTANNERQCLFPEGAEIMESEVGSAAGFCVEVGETLAAFLPGPPREYRWFLDAYVEELMRRKGWTHPETTSTSLHFFGVGESQLEDRLEDVGERAHTLDVTMAWRADFPVITLTLRGADNDAVEEIAQAAILAAKPYAIGRDDEGLIERVGRLLTERAETVTAAESCTAGLLMGALTSISGSSAYVERGFVTYADTAKQELVGVHLATLQTHGAVSAQVACQMASGARDTAAADWGIGISGIAGPTGGTPDKPVGTVHFAVAGAGGTWHRHVHLRGFDRAQVRQASVYVALTLLLWHLEDSLAQRPISGPFTDEEVWRPEGLDPEVLAARHQR